MFLAGFRRGSGPSWVRVFLPLLMVLMALLTLYPVSLIFLKSFTITRPGQPVAWGIQGWVAAFSDVALPLVLANTFSLAVVRIVITTVLAIFFVWVVTRTDTPFRGFLELVLWLGFFLPLLPMTMGWILLLDPHNGVLNKFLVGIFGLSRAPFDIFSYWGIVWCHLAFSTSIRFLLMTPAFKAMDAALEEAALTSGSNKLGTLLRITVPLLAPAILASTILGFIKSLESLEIELVLGIPAGLFVVPTKIFDYINWEPPLYGRATALSSIFLVVIFVLIWLQRVLLHGREYTTITGRGYVSRTLSLGPWRWLTFSICLLFILIMVLLPLSALFLGTFMEVFGFFNLESTWTTRHWIEAVDDPTFMRSLWNTLVLGVGASAVGVTFYALVSYCIVRVRFTGRGLMDLLSWLPWALPGILLSLGLLWAVLGSGSILRVIYGTLFVLILAIIIKEMPVGIQIVKAGVMQISSELEEASAVSGASWTSTFRRIQLPLLNPTLMAVGLILFIAAVRDVSSVVFLATHQTKTLSLLMLDYIPEGNLEQAAIIGVFTVFLILLVVLASRLLGMRLGLEQKD